MNLVLLDKIKTTIPSCREKIIELLALKEIDFK